MANRNGIAGQETRHMYITAQAFQNKFAGKNEAVRFLS